MHKLLTSKPGPPFAPLHNRFIFDFHKTLYFPMEVTFSASHSTTKALDNTLPPFPAISMPCTFALVYASTAWKEQNSTWIKDVSTSSSPSLPLLPSKRFLQKSPQRSVSLHNLILRFMLLEVIWLIYTSTGIVWFVQLSFTALTYNRAVSKLCNLLWWAHEKRQSKKHTTLQIYIYVERSFCWNESERADYWLLFLPWIYYHLISQRLFCLCVCAHAYRHFSSRPLPSYGHRKLLQWEIGMHFCVWISR